MNEQMEELTQRHRRAFRAMFALIGVFLLMACLTVFVSTIRGRAASVRPTPDSPLPAARAAQTPQASEPRATQIALGATQAPPQTSEPAAAAVAQPVPSDVKSARPQAPARAAKVQSPQAAPAAAPIAIGSAPSAPSASSASKPDVVASFGFLTIDTSPWSQVSVGGRVLGQTPLIGIRLPTGSQVLSLKNPELGIETSYPITIENGKTTVRRIGIE